MTNLSNKIISDRADVVTFLTDLKAILNSEEFNIDTDLDILLKKRLESPIDPFTTGNTMLELEFDRHDVFTQLLSLDLSEYIETFIDNINPSLPPFYTFGRVISNRDIYIKLKIKDKANHKVFCVSFHFARYPLTTNRPYA